MVERWVGQTSISKSQATSKSVEGASIPFSKSINHPVQHISLHINICGRMMVVKWKHQMSNSKFRGNFEVAVSMLEYTRVPFVSNNDVFHTQNIEYRCRKPPYRVATGEVRIFYLPQVPSMGDIRDLKCPSFFKSCKTLQHSSIPRYEASQ